MDITELLDFSVKHNASDLHLSAGVPPMIRVDGDVRKLSLPELSHPEVHQLVFDIMNDVQRRDYEQELEVDFSFELSDIGRFRANVFHQARGCAAVFRVIPNEMPSLASLGVPEVFYSIAEKPRGLILVTGATGSGKSTTTAALVDHINQHTHRHILTIEDPIEFVHQSKRSLMNQREVHRDTHSFQVALRSALREDPDVIVVGEMRDVETISLALTAAETGHLVLGTLHTSSAAKTIDRVIDVFPANDKAIVRSMLSESLQAVIAQQLIKRAEGGRVAAHEVMVVTPALRNLIRDDKVAQMYSMIQTGGSVGMQTMEQSINRLVTLGEIAPEVGQRLLGGRHG